MEKIFYTPILILLVILAFGKYFWDIFLWIFVLKMKVVKGKIIRLKSKKFLMTPAISTSNLFFQDLSPSYQAPIILIEYFVFLEEANNHRKYYLEVPLKTFEELKEKKISTLKNISFYFKNYFLGDNFDHIEIT